MDEDVHLSPESRQLLERYFVFKLKDMPSLAKRKKHWKLSDVLYFGNPQPRKPKKKQKNNDGHRRISQSGGTHTGFVMHEDINSTLFSSYPTRPRRGV